MAFPRHYLPHPRINMKLAYNIDLSMGTLDGNIKYLENCVKYLESHKLIVSLMMDPELSFKRGKMYGNATNGSGLAKTVQVFMISSLFSKYKDVVALIPVSNLKSSELKEMTFKNIWICGKKIGSQMISIVSDNNNINRKSFELLTPNKLSEELHRYFSFVG